MRILCINYEYPPIGGGGAAACRGLAEKLVELGNEVDVVTTGMKDLPQFEEVNGVGIYRVRCIRRHRHYTTTSELATQVLPTYWKALELIRDRGPYDINHTHFIVPSGLSSYLLWKKTGLPYVVTLHGSDVPGYNPDRFGLSHLLIRPIWKAIIRNSETLISPSHFLKEMVEKHTGAPVEVVPHGIQLPRFPDYPKSNKILVVTRMFARKGVQFFLRALETLDTDWEVCIAGDGPYFPTIQKMVRELRRSVNLLGYVTGSALSELYHSARVFVFPSSQENFPVVLLEAMNAGCAVITTNASGCSEVVQDAAVKVPPENVGDLRDALDRLIHDDLEIDRLVQLGRERVSKLSWTNVAKLHEEVFAAHAQ